MSGISDIWTLEVHPPGGGHTTQTLDAWQITNPVIKRSNLTRGGFSFDVPVAEVTNGAVIPNKSRVVLFRDGVRWWEGRMTRPRGSIAPGQETMRFTADDSFYYFQALAAHQKWFDALGIAQELGRGTFFAKWEGAFDTGDLVPVSCGEEMTVIGQTVIADLAAGGDYRGAGVNPLIALGTIDNGQVPPSQKMGTSTFFEWLQKAAHYDTSRVTWWDYSQIDSTTPPTMVSRLGANLPVVTLPFSPTACTIAPWLDGKVSVVDVVAKIQDGSLGPPLTTAFGNGQYPVSYTGSRLNNIIIPLDGDSFFDLTKIQALAQAVWEEGQYVGWRGNYRIVEPECSGALRMGMLLNLSGGDPAWASMNIPVQSVTEYLATGETECEFGPPAHLSAADMMELILPHHKGIRASVDEHKEKKTGKSNSTNFGHKKEKDGDVTFPPAGWEIAEGLLYSENSDKAEDVTYTRQKTALGVTQTDPTVAVLIKADGTLVTAKWAAKQL